MPRLVGLPRPVRAVAPAKVNLALAVGPLRDDGYHELTTVFHAVDLQERVTLTPSAGLSCTVSGVDAAEVPTGEDNLAVRAVLLLAEEAGVEPAVAIEIDKRVPVAAGLAGGSADAAAALVAAATLWRLDLSRDDLAALGARLGSDVPFALHGGTALGTGRGEQLSPVLARGRFSWVLALAEGGLSTPAVYEALDRLRERAVPRPATLPDAALSALVSGDPARLGRALVNDLQPAAVSLRPAIRRTLSAGLEEGALGAVVSGSGPTVAFLARDAEGASRLAAALSASGTCRTVRRASGPAPGAHVVDDA